MFKDIKLKHKLCFEMTSTKRNEHQIK